MARQRYNIVLVGSGNVAHHLGRALKLAGHRMVQVMGRNNPGGERLAFALGCPFKLLGTEIPDEADIVLLCVKDDAIGAVAQQIHCPGRVVAHTAGNVPITALADCSDRLGVFYPLQMLRQGTEVDMAKVPFCIEANTTWTEGFLLELARSISANVQVLDSGQRKLAHLAAVFACNFSNHLYATAQEILSHQGLSLDLLRPLILQTAVNIQNGDPSKLQTGPAARNDVQVIEAQLEMLRSIKPDLVPIYEQLTLQIREASQKRALNAPAQR